jgi:hypothetical protein
MRSSSPVACTRRGFLTGVAASVACRSTGVPRPTGAPAGFQSLFDGRTLTGWHPAPRLPLPRHPGLPPPDPESPGYRRALTSQGRWTVEGGVLVGAQDPPQSRLGGYLITDRAFADFELLIDARPDWPVDTGILVRATPQGPPGFQVLVDHRRSGGLGGFYGNGTGGFHAVPYSFSAKLDQAGKPMGLVPDDSAERVDEQKRRLLAYAAPVDDFLAAWRWNDWNTFRIRCQGQLPYLTTWVNGLRIAELDTAKITWPGYDAAAISSRLGRSGHIALEVHDSPPNDRVGAANRWAPGAVCRWRNIFIKELNDA